MTNKIKCLFCGKVYDDLFEAFSCEHRAFFKGLQDYELMKEILRPKKNELFAHFPKYENIE
jgi:hypothetical protein